MVNKVTFLGARGNDRTNHYHPPWIWSRA